MDAVAATYVDLVLSTSDLPSLVNLVHPISVSWHDMFNAMNKCLRSPLPFISLEEWIKKLEMLSVEAGPEELEKMVSEPCRCDVLD